VKIASHCNTISGTFLRTTVQNFTSLRCWNSHRQTDIWKLRSILSIAFCSHNETSVQYRIPVSDKIDDELGQFLY